MIFRNAVEEAFHRGEKIKDQIVSDVLNSQIVNELLQNEFFLRSLAKVLNTKYEISKAVRSNFKIFLKAFNVPSRDEIHIIERKIHRLENEIDGIHRKILTSRLAKSKKSDKVPSSQKVSRKSGSHSKTR